jgi:hypothetical protein
VARRPHRPLVTRRNLLAGAVALTAAATPAALAAKPKTADHESGAVDVAAKPIRDFFRLGTGKTFGALTFRGGLVLSSADERFGGWSGIAMDPDGRRFLAVSDAGTWLLADLVYDGKQPAAVTTARMGPLLASDGRPLTRLRDRDPEAVALIDGTLDRGTVVIAFERNARIGRFPVAQSGVGRPASYFAMPADARRLNNNHALEAVTVLRAGRHRGSIVAIAERIPDQRGHHTGWIWIAGRPERLALTRVPGFDVTDAAGLPDGGLLVLERSFSWLSGVAMRLRRIPADEIAPGAVLDGEVLVQADLSYDIDNMEGVTVHDDRGETVVTLISDDNFNGLLQRTVLLQFTLAGVQTARVRN